jgi:hypothetical protein
MFVIRALLPCEEWLKVTDFAGISMNEDPLREDIGVRVPQPNLPAELA